MRFFCIVLLILVLSSATVAQEDVLVVFDQTAVNKNDSLHIQLFLSRPQQVEVAVFTAEQLFVAEKSQLDKGRTDYKLPLTGIWTGKFTLLVEGESFHEEFKFEVY